MKDDFKKSRPAMEVCPCARCTPRPLQNKPNRIARKRLKQELRREVRNG